MELPLSSTFYTTHPFAKKLNTLKTSGEKILTMEHLFFFSKFEIMQWNGVINKQKQPPEVFYKKRCSKKFHKIHRKVSVLEFLFFNEVAGLAASE